MSAQQIAALKERAKMNTPVKSRGGSGEDAVNLCICNRQLQDILCRSCGYLFVGRQRRQCYLHPNEIHLMDAAVCPKCRTSSLIEIKTSDTPVKKDEDKIITELSHLRQRRISGKASSEDGISPTFSMSHHTRNATRDEDLENELGLCYQSKTSSETELTVFTSMPSKSVSTSQVTSNASLVSFDTSLTPKKSPARPNASHSLKSVPEFCTAADWEEEIGSLNIPKATPTVYTATHGLSGKHNQVFSTESRNDYGNVTFAFPKTESDAHVTKAPCGYVQQKEDQGSSKTACKLVDSEVQTDFVVQVLEGPMYSHPVNPAQQQTQASQRNGYMYQPKRPVDGGNETSILKAAIKRSIAQGWHREIDKLNDLCLGDR